MMNFIKNIILLILLCGCATHSSVSQKNNQQINEWELLNQIKVEKWNREKFLEILGRPSSILKEEKTEKEYWIYRDKNLDKQKWSIGASVNGKVFAITFIPNISNRDLFKKENIRDYWGNACIEKQEVITKGHYIDNIYYLDCGEGRRVYLNNLGEISSLLIVPE